MAYQLKSVTIRTNNSAEGMQVIEEIWKDITSGKLPLLYDSTRQLQQDISPVSKYHNYAGDESGDYDLSILAVTRGFFQEMEKAVGLATYVKYDIAHESLALCAKGAWEKVWDDQKNGVIQRAYTEDYESAMPAEYTKDGKAHCCLYIAVK